MAKAQRMANIMMGKEKTRNTEIDRRVRKKTPGTMTHKRTLDRRIGKAWR